jgi:hypothetical protein
VNIRKEETEMKKIILSSVLAIMSGMALAQSYVRIDTVIRPYIQFDYMAWMDSGNPLIVAPKLLSYCYCHPDSMWEEDVAGDLLQYNYIEGGADIVGLTIWLSADCGPHCSANQSENLYPNEYLYLYDATPDSFVLKGSFVVDLINSDSPSNRQHWLSRYTQIGIDSCPLPMDSGLDTLAYEYRHYFDKPVHVDDSFYVGTSYSQYKYAEMLYEWAQNPTHDSIPHWRIRQYWVMSTMGVYTRNDNSQHYGDECQMPYMKKKIRWKMDEHNPIHHNFLPNHFPLNEWAPTESRDFWMVFPLIETYDTIWAEELPDCLPVTGFSLLSRSGDTVVLRWNRDSEHDEYQLSYGPEGTPPDSGTFVSCTNNKWRHVDTLFNGTSYVAYVRTVCRDGDTLRYSDWSEGVVWETRNAGIPNNGLQHTLKMIPNPATENVSLFSDCLINGVDVYRSDGVKQTSLSCQNHSAGFSVKDWPKGMYIVVVHTTQGDITKKLIVE